MQRFNYLPSIEQLNFFQSQTGNNDLDNIYDFEQVFELAMSVTLGGFKYLHDPENNNEFQPFYLNILTYVQRGMRDRVIHGLVTEYFDDTYSEATNVQRMLTLTKFRNSQKEDGFAYDFISHIYYVEIFITRHKITTDAELNEEIIFPYRWNLLFRTKIPYVNSVKDIVDSNEDGGTFFEK